MCVARIVPLPGKESPIASVREFIELAVNIPEQHPQPGHERFSISASSSSLTVVSAAFTIAEIRSRFCPCQVPFSIGPPETNTVGIFRRIDAINIPGVILSQFDIQTSASTLWALHIYSTLSAIISREGREYNIPSCPIAMPSSMAIVLNSAA